jgi:hypothetical protein
MFTPEMMFVLAWPLLVDTLFTIVTIGNWSPRLYSKAFNSDWLERWYQRATPRGGE